jgi:hypothetical protein
LFEWREVSGHVARCEGQLAAGKQRITRMELQGHVQGTSDLLSLVSLVVAGRDGSAHPPGSNPARQLWYSDMWRARQDEQVLSQQRQLLAQSNEAFHQKAVTLSAHASHIAPGSGGRPAIDEKELISLPVGQQSRVVMQAQVVLEPVDVGHFRILARRPQASPGRSPRRRQGIPWQRA